MLSIRSFRALWEQIANERQLIIDEYISLANVSNPMLSGFRLELISLLKRIIDNDIEVTRSIFSVSQLSSIGFRSVSELKVKCAQISVAWRGRVFLKVEESADKVLVFIFASLPEKPKVATDLSNFRLMLWDGKKLHIATDEHEYLSGEVLEASQKGDNLADVLVRLFSEGLN